MSVLYQYTIERRENFKTRNIDGLYLADKPIETMEEYREFKQFIAEVKTPEEAAQWIVLSLSKLETYEDGQHKIL